MFISVGPSAFTVIGIVQLGQAADEVLEDRLVAKVLQVGTVMVGVWLWGLACWVFLVSLAANVKTAESGRLHFGLGWWSFVFPNTAFVLATFAGEYFGRERV